MLPYDGNLKERARDLRRHMAPAERLLWSKIRMKQSEGCQFYRQRIIGHYIVDFFCPRARLVVEVDGGQHYSDEMRATDETRDAYMKSRGLAVLRFSNAEVFGNVVGVVDAIVEHLSVAGGKIPL